MLWPRLWLVCWLAAVIGATVVYEQYDDQDQYREFAASDEKALFPSIFNLATGSVITANATCGEKGPEIACKLTEHVYNRKPQCDVCDNNDVYRRHPIENAIDGTTKFWQSPSLANGLDYERVDINIDLRQEYQVAYIIVKSGSSPPPATWVVERSIDGVEYHPWQYFARHEPECMRVFGVAATPGMPRYKSDTDVICTTAFSRLDRLENGEVHLSLVNGRPGANKPTEELQEFTRTRYIRMRLIQLSTLNADLMIVNRKVDHDRLDQSVTRRYFYTIADISIGGQCICNGHAETCPSDPVTGQLRCECRHNTCGESCNKCCPLFNQLAYQRGTHENPNICQACQCFNHADSCEYDEEIHQQGLSMTPEGIFEGGGRCVDCQHNTEGVNCERCKDGFYRPSGITHYRQDACRECDCDPVGSEHGTCVKSEADAVSGQQPGDCICKPGFGGRRCDRCAPGYRNHPVCEPCPCNQAGSLNFDSCEETSCICKQNVQGQYCDRCKPGTINLDHNNPMGCQQCFCFGLSGECVEKELNAIEIRDYKAWNLTDYYGRTEIIAKEDNNSMLMFTASDYKDHSLHYWKAPESYSGNKLTSYGGNLKYHVYYVPSNNPRATNYTSNFPDVILEGNGIKLEYHSMQTLFPRENISQVVPIREGDKWYNSLTRQRAEKADLMRALADVSYVLVRAVYMDDQLQSSIYGLAFDSTDGEVILGSEEQPSGARRVVESCACPENIAGYSCESCVKGFRRVNNQLYGGRCEKCNCGDHTDDCDPETGRCLNCQHNTTGDRCERCIDGHYGNPSLGGLLGSCQPCACPSIDNNHSTQCALSQLVLEVPAGQDAYVCTACEEGYEGTKCEICADGYFGDPLSANGTCQPCECNGNTDEMAIGNCDRKTGECLKCIGHTTGEHCEQCKENHWGSALAHTCKPCGCHRTGATDLQCDADTGDCACQENYEGKQCDRCKPGHGDVDNHCPACECSSLGAHGNECDEVSGQCVCKSGVFGKKCDMCQLGYYNFTDAGCKFCHCDEFGAVDGGKCNNVTGKCECRENADGLMCEKCVDGFFNITSGQGCEPCGCSETGSQSVHCDIHSGQCACKPGITGLKCDQCAPNHYGFSDDGCKECQVCPAPGQVCDSVTGECVCPQNTVGEMCENCTANAWNHHPLKGCELCECSEIGAESPECDAHTGQCKCKSGYVGAKCDRCTHGYYNFPKCEPCNCNVAGTNPNECNGDLCLCDENGQCPCKKNVKGLKCDTCDANSFSLEANNPLGCTDCFCFNRSTFCVQSNLVWQQVYADDRRVVFADNGEYYTRKHNVLVLKELPLNYSSYLTDGTPLYWPMPKKFLGDRTTSYNGYLRFKIHNDDKFRRIAEALPDPQLFKLYPQVVLVGGYRIELRYIPTEINTDGKYRIHFHENNWIFAKRPDRKVTRKEMMIVLQNVQALYVRATYIYPSRDSQATISEVSLDIATFENTTDIGSQIAIGVEMCDACPQGYTGLSCQNPAEGYFRKKPDLDDPEDIKLVGLSTPCECNGHSNTCDAETGSCTNCDHNTQGEFCERCKKGYHGDAREGTADSCQKCACPLAENSFSDTCQSHPYGRGYVCDACKPGYAGQYCEACSVGYYGNPNTPGGFCDECACHPHGSTSPTCDGTTGQCECLEGVTGRDCSRCQERHAFINGVCTSCDRGCTKILMEMVDEIKGTLGDMDFKDVRPVPRRRLERIEGNVTTVKEILSSMKDTVTEAENVLKKEGPVDSSIISEATIVADQARYILERGEKSHNTMQQFVDEAMRISDKAREHFADIWQTVNQLKQFIISGGGEQSAAFVDRAVADGEAFLKGIREREDYISKRYSRGKSELEKAEELLNKVNEKKLNETEFKSLRESADQIQEVLEDLRDTIRVGYNYTISTEGLLKVLDRRLDATKSGIAAVDGLFKNAEQDISEANDRVNAAKSEHFMSIYDDYQLFTDSLLGAVKNNSDQCVNRADKYAQLLNEYSREYKYASQEHARELEHEAKRLENILAEAKGASANPVRASNAYNDIAAALKNASNAAVAANKAAEKAYEDVDPTSESSMVVAVAKSRKESDNLTAKVLDLDSEVSGSEISDDMQNASKRMKTISDSIEDHILPKVAKIKEDFGKFDDNNERVKSLSSVDDILKNVETANANVTNFANSIDKMEKEVIALKDVDGHGIRDVITDVKNQNEELQKLQSIFDDSRRDTAEQEKTIKDLNDQLATLKEKIKEAREIASKIPIATKSADEGTCVRSFISPAFPSPTNTFSIRYRPNKSVQDALIMLTRTRGTRTQASEYFAIELKDRRIIAYWDIGSGGRQATNTYTLSYIPDSDSFTWYHIDVTRNGNAVSVTVAKKQTRREGGSVNIGEPVEVRVGQVDSTQDVVFNTVPGQTVVTLGSIDSKLTEQIPVSTHRFRGTVGELIVDGEKIALWTFSHSSGKCEGAVGVDNPISEGHMFRNGYAHVRSTGSRIGAPTLQILFRAYSSNGLLYFRGNQQAKDFIALELRKGRVVCKINLGGDSFVEVQTEKDSYNDGLLHKVFCTAKNGQLILKGEENKYAAAIPGENTVLNEPNGDNYIAGVPDDYDKSAFADYSIQWDGFFGCIQQIKSSTADLDFEKADRSLNMQRGCALKNDKLDLTDRVFGFPQPGYIVTRGVELSSNGSFAFTARTKEANATLIFQSVKLSTVKRSNRQAVEGKGFMAFYLYQGYLVCHVGIDASLRKNLLTMRTTELFNDGLPHSVFLAREGEHFYLRVDDKQIDVKTLADESTIGSASGQMFIGGFPDNMRPNSNELPTRSSLIGCISDIFVDYKRVPIVPEMYEATLGTCVSDEGMITSDEFPLADEEAASFLRKSSKLSLQLTEPTVSVGEYLAYTQELDDEPAIDNQEVKKDDSESPTEEPRLRYLGRECHKGEFNYDGDGAALFGITTSTNSRINFPNSHRPDPKSFHVDFEFKTKNPDGNLWIWAAYKNYTRYYLLNMVDGFLHLEIQGHKKPKQVVMKGRKLNDNQWHRIDIMQANHEMRLKIDAATALTIKDAPIPRVMKKRMYVGGVISKHRRLFNHILKVPGFSGCIRAFNVDDKPYDLFEAQRDVIPCSTPSKGVYIHDGGFATFDSFGKFPERNVIDLYIQVRPGRSNGLIASVMNLLNVEESARAHLMFGLRDGKPTLELTHKDKQFHFNHTFNRDLCNDEWHTVHLLITQRSVKLELNTISEKIDVQIPRSTMTLMRNLPVHIGGLPAKQADNFGYTSIIGCVRGMSLSNKDVSFADARRLLKVVPGGCPYDA